MTKKEFGLRGVNIQRGTKTIKWVDLVRLALVLVLINKGRHDLGLNQFSGIKL